MVTVLIEVDLLAVVATDCHSLGPAVVVSSLAADHAPPELTRNLSLLVLYLHL